MTKEEAKRFGLQLLHGIMERNESYPIYANNVKQAIDALSEPSGNSEIPKDLGEAADESWQNSPDKGIYDEYSPFYKDGFIAGAKWDREQIIKKAVEGQIYGSDGSHWIETDIDENIKGKEGDKVRIIIVKEGEK